MSPSQAQPQHRPDKAEIAEWIRERMAEELGREPSSIDIRKPFSRYGLDSVTAVLLTGELEQWLGRPIQPDLLGQYTSIEALSAYLVETSAAPETAAPEPLAEVQPWVRRPWSPFGGFIRALTNRLARTAIQFELEDETELPASGPFIFACNHLDMIDAVVMAAILRRPVVFFVSEHMKQFTLLEWYVAQLGRGIYVARGEADREALAEAVAALKAGETLAVAPEGTISPTGALQKGQAGVAFLAMRANVPVLPVVAFGQEKSKRLWKRLRRPVVRVRVGKMIDPPRPDARTQHLEEFTERVMVAMARLLPEEYRGVYSEAAARAPADSIATSGRDR